MAMKKRLLQMSTLACLILGGLTGCESASTEYSFTLKNKLNNPLSGVTVSIKGKSGVTDNDGKVTFKAPSGNYEVKFADLETGYFLDETLKTSADVTEYEVEFNSKTIKDEFREEGKKYKIGDVFCDFTGLNVDQKKVNYADLVEGKKGVLLNFWGTQCQYCRYEFPYLQAAYEKYSDDFVIVAVDDGVWESSKDASKNFESMRNFWKRNGYTFPTLYCQPESKFFSISGYPTSYVIDRYGFIVKEEVGAMAMSEADQPAVDKLFERMIADDYVPRIANANGTFADEVIEDVPDASTFAPAASDIDLNFEHVDGTWPWVYDEEKGAMKPTNGNKHSSTSQIDVSFELTTSKAITFDYYLSSEDGDYFSVDVDNYTQLELGGEVNEWRTASVFYPVYDGTFTMTFSFTKDIYRNGGDDTVLIKNIRAVDLSEITEEFTVIRSAASGPRDEESNAYYYITPVLNIDDGLYHVNSENGPLLKVNYFWTTYWTRVTSFYSALYATYGNSLGNMKIYNYLLQANSASDGHGNADSKVVEYIESGMAAIRRYYADDLELSESAPDLEWLEICCYYDTYTPGV